MAQQSLKATADAYAAHPSRELLDQLCVSLESESISLQDIVYASKTAGKATQEDAKLLEAVIKACEKQGADAVKFGACDAIYAVGNNSKKNPDTAAATLIWVRQCSPMLGPMYSDVLIKAGLVRLSLEIGESHFHKSEVITRECLDTLVSLIKSGTARTQKQLRLMGVSELLSDVEQKYASNEVIVARSREIVSLLRMDVKPGGAGLFCCLAMASAGSV